MGEFTNGVSPDKIASADKNDMKMSSDDGFETDVETVKADGEKLGLPVFKVDKDEFYQNMKYGRQRLRFKSGTKAQQYMQSTKYKNPFWIEHEGFLRKIK
jgi:hypothetical protein